VLRNRSKRSTFSLGLLDRTALFVLSDEMRGKPADRGELTAALTFLAGRKALAVALSHFEVYPCILVVPRIHPELLMRGAATSAAAEAL
jgi:hypothetical protein